LDVINDIFGERIYSAVETSANRISEKIKGPTLQITESVRSKFPRNNSEDAIICLNIGFDSELIRSLFPMAYEKLFRPQTDSRDSLVGTIQTPSEHQGMMIPEMEIRK
jgi:hypothetical protein